MGARLTVTVFCLPLKVRMAMDSWISALFRHRQSGAEGIRTRTLSPTACDALLVILCCLLSNLSNASAQTNASAHADATIHATAVSQNHSQPNPQSGPQKEHVTVTYSIEVQRSGKRIKVDPNQLKSGDKVQVHLQSSINAYVLILASRASVFDPSGRPLAEREPFKVCYPTRTTKDNSIKPGIDYILPPITVTGPSRIRILLSARKSNGDPTELMKRMQVASVTTGMKTLDLSFRGSDSTTVEGNELGSGLMFDINAQPASD